MLGRVVCRNVLHQASLLRLPLLAHNNAYSTASNKPHKINPKKNIKKTNSPEPRRKDGGSGKDKTQIQAMPNSLTRLITNTKVEGWPSLTNIAILTSKCHQA